MVKPLYISYVLFLFFLTDCIYLRFFNFFDVTLICLLWPVLLRCVVCCGLMWSKWFPGFIYAYMIGLFGRGWRLSGCVELLAEFWKEQTLYIVLMMGKNLFFSGLWELVVVRSIISFCGGPNGCVGEASGPNWLPLFFLFLRWLRVSFDLGFSVKVVFPPSVALDDLFVGWCHLCLFW